ncbi:MAG: SRPBCC family protein [Gammaproteobacteria bacterium]|nr:SRPBCC family protein [Gammaproteobacteria bacterium]
MRISAALYVFALLAWSATIAAHGPSRQKVVVEVQITAAPDKVWEKIGNFQDMSWHPAVESVVGNGGNSIGATRTLTLKGGGMIHEKLDKYDTGKQALFYRIDKVDVTVLPVTNYSSWLNVKPSADGGSIVTWKGAFYRGYPNNDPPQELNDQAAVDAVTGVYNAGLNSLKSALENQTQ